MRSIVTFSAALLCGFSGMMLGTQVAVAQSANDLQTSGSQEPLKVFEQEDPDDLGNVLSDRSSGTSLLNLLNRIQQVNSRSPGEFAEDQSESFNGAVDNFRKRQQEQLGGQTSEPSEADDEK